MPKFFILALLNKNKTKLLLLTIEFNFIFIPRITNKLSNKIQCD